MLAYVFWHWRRPQIATAEYEARQRAFHASLAAAPPEGYEHSASVAIAGAPWAHGGGEAYEDWYLVRGAAALEPLNAGAISASRQQPHDAAAAVAAGGTAGLYLPRVGTLAAEHTHAAWFGKPDGVSYAQLLDELAPLVQAARGALWMRFMVLGPAPEFCVRTEGGVTLPAHYAPRTITGRRVWPPA
jgi:hypothetical protein